jgi:hypothetical protein
MPFGGTVVRHWQNYYSGGFKIGMWDVKPAKFYGGESKSAMFFI